MDNDEVDKEVPEAESDAAQPTRDRLTGEEEGAAGTSAADEISGEMVGQLTDMVRERPILALLGAAAVGYALALLLHGGRR